MDSFKVGPFWGGQNVLCDDPFDDANFLAFSGEDFPLPPHPDFAINNHEVTDVPSSLLLTDSRATSELTVSEAFLVKKRSDGVEWDDIVEEYSRKFTPITKEALGMRLSRLKRKHPYLKTILPNRRAKAASSGKKLRFSDAKHWNVDRLLRWLLVHHPSLFEAGDHDG